MGGWSLSGKWYYFPPMPEMPGCWTSLTNWRPGWPGDGDPVPIHLEETETSFAIGWKGRYHIEGPAFIYADRDTGRVTTVLGYPTQTIARAG